MLKIFALMKILTVKIIFKGVFGHEGPQGNGVLRAESTFEKEMCSRTKPKEPGRAALYYRNFRDMIPPRRSGITRI